MAIPEIAEQRPLPLTPKKFTYRDYLNLSDERCYELMEGELRMAPAPTPEHQTISNELAFGLTQFVKGRKLGRVLTAPCDVVLGEEHVLEPDLLFISQERLSIIQAKNIQGAPDLVVEILSPDSAYRDFVSKKRLYARFGVQEYWIVDPMAKTVDVLVLKGNHFDLYQQFTHEEILHSPLLVELALPLRELFE